MKVQECNIKVKRKEYCNCGLPLSKKLADAIGINGGTELKVFIYT